MEIIQIEKDVLDAVFERMTYLHKTMFTLFERIHNKNSGDWLSLEETCQILNVSERKVRNLQSGGRIGFVKHGKRSRYKADDVFAIIRKGGVNVE